MDSTEQPQNIEAGSLSRVLFRAKIAEYIAKCQQKFDDAKKALEDSETGSMDEDGYPLDVALNVIETWFDPKYSSDSLVRLFEFVNSLWYMKAWGWSCEEAEHEHKPDQKVIRFKISTAGWSGNESVIHALQKNNWVWHSTWVQSRKGGHYIFEIQLDPPEEEHPEEPF